MSERFAGVDEANTQGYAQGLRTAQRTILSEARGKNHSLNYFATQLVDLLQKAIDRVEPQEKVIHE